MFSNHYKLTMLLALASILAAGKAFSVGDCFSDYCTGLETVSGWSYGFFVYPSGDSADPAYFSHLGTIDYDDIAGPEIFAIAGKAYFSDASGGEFRDQVDFNVDVLDTDTKDVVAEFSVSARSPKYMPFVPGQGGYFFSWGGGLVNTNANSVVVAFILKMQSLLLNDERGYVKVEVYDTDGQLRWKKTIKELISKGKWQLADLRRDQAIDNAVLFGDFLGNDEKDELRVIYWKKSSTDLQRFKIFYYNARTGKLIRTDAVNVPVPD